MKRVITCIGCPMGCQITAEREEGSQWKLDGFQCRVGERYAYEELTHPQRSVTGLVQLAGRLEPLSVKTTAPIPKEKVANCAALMREIVATPPIQIGDVVLTHICGTEVDLVATSSHT